MKRWTKLMPVAGLALALLLGVGSGESGGTGGRGLDPVFGTERSRGQDGSLQH